METILRWACTFRGPELNQRPGIMIRITICSFFVLEEQAQRLERLLRKVRPGKGPDAPLIRAAELRLKRLQEPLPVQEQLEPEVKLEEEGVVPIVKHQCCGRGQRPGEARRHHGPSATGRGGVLWACWSPTAAIQMDLRREDGRGPNKRSTRTRRTERQAGGVELERQCPKRPAEQPEPVGPSTTKRLAVEVPVQVEKQSGLLMQERPSMAQEAAPVPVPAIPVPVVPAVPAVPPAVPPVPEEVKVLERLEAIEASKAVEVEANRGTKSLKSFLGRRPGTRRVTSPQRKTHLRGPDEGLAAKWSEGALQLPGVELPEPIAVLTPHGANRQRVFQRRWAGLTDVRSLDTLTSNRVGFEPASTKVVVASRGLLIRSEGPCAAEALLSLRWGCVVVDEPPKAGPHRHTTAEFVDRCQTPSGSTVTDRRVSSGQVWTLLRTVEAHEGWELGAFESRFSRPILKGQKRKASAKDLAVREDALKEFQELLARNCLRRRPKTHCLCRTKDDVALMLPGKNDRVVPCPLSHLQRAAYQNLLESPDFQIALGKRELCVCGAGRPCFCGAGPVWRYVHRRQAESKGLEDEWAAADECACRGRKSPKCMALSLIVILQRLCNHLEQLKPDAQPPKDSAEANQQETKLQLPKSRLKLQDLMRELCDLAFKGIDHNLCSQRRVANRLQLGDPEACGKMQVLLPLLRHWRRRMQKVLIFSRSTSRYQVVPNRFRSLRKVESASSAIFGEEQHQTLVRFGDRKRILSQKRDLTLRKSWRRQKKR
eukprot:g15689.t1